VGSGLGSVRKTGKHTLIFLNIRLFLITIPHYDDIYHKMDIVVMFNDMPMISYDGEKPGWHHVYNGILSPFANKYKVYIKTELKSRAKEKEK
jgi:hypothetical protein